MELGSTGRTAAANVQRLRKAQGVSLRKLAERLHEVGRPLSADALNKIENGADPAAKTVRRIDVDDLAALAVALGVNPSALLLPVDVGRDDTIEVTGVGEVSAGDAWLWADGKMPLQSRGVSTEGTLAAGRAMYTAYKSFELLGRPHWFAYDAEADFEDARDLIEPTSPDETLTKPVPLDQFLGAAGFDVTVQEDGSYAVRPKPGRA